MIQRVFLNHLYPALAFAALGIHCKDLEFFVDFRSMQPVAILQACFLLG
ncbi:MAG: hypothetical protein QXI22_06615 [Sulfolobales archaeon]